MKLSKEDQTFLELYSDSEYEKPSVTVDSVVFRMVDEKVENYRKLPEKKLQVLLLKRGWPPFQNCYALPGTFIDLQFELSETMKQCVKNKVGLENYYYEQLFTFGDKGRDPRTRVLSVSYMLLTNSEANATNGEWFDVNIVKSAEQKMLTPDGYTLQQNYVVSLFNNNQRLQGEIELLHTKSGLQEFKQIRIVHSSLAFDHIKMIFFAHERLKNKAEYTDIVFNLIPSLFTLTELKLAYELILGEKLLDANFRRKTAKMVQATNEFMTGKGHRSSQLFRLNPNWNTSNLD